MNVYQSCQCLSDTGGTLEVYTRYVSSKLSPDYHTSHSHECMGVSEKALQLHAVLKKPFLYHKSHKNLNQYCHAKSVSGTYCEL